MFLSLLNGKMLFTSSSVAFSFDGGTSSYPSGVGECSLYHFYCCWAKLLMCSVAVSRQRQPFHRLVFDSDNRLKVPSAFGRKNCSVHIANDETWLVLLLGVAGAC